MISFTRIKNGASAELIAYKKNRVISLILLSFAALIYGFGLSVSNSSAHFYPSGLAIFIYFASLPCLYSACMNSFKDMHDRPSADVQMSMPLSSTERYLSRLLTICIIWVIPLLISAAVGILIAAGLNFARFEPNTGIIFSESLKMLLWFLAAAFFIISVTVICQCCTGAKAESRYMPMLLMFVLSLAPVGIYELSDTFASISLEKNDIPFYSVWTFSELIELLDNDSDYFILHTLLNCLISIAVIWGGLYLYKRRDARSVGIPVVFRLFLEITVFTSLTLLFTVMHASYFNGIIFFLAWLGSIILRIVTARKSFSFKKIGLWTLLFGAYYLVFLVLMFISFKTGNFGALYRTPNMSELYASGIEMYIDIEESYDYRRHSYSYSYNYDELMSERFRYTNQGKNVDVTKSFMKISSRYAMKSSGNNEMWFMRMFGKRVRKKYYSCSIRLYKDKTTYNYGQCVYRIDFTLPKEDAQKLRDELREAEYSLINIDRYDP